MGLVLSDGEIGALDKCIHRDLLTYVSYPAFKGASRCFSYPQFLVQDGTFTLLENSAFPDNGCLPMVVSSATPHEMQERFGNIVIMRVNDESPSRNRNYPESEQSRYNSIIDPYFPRGASAVEFMPLSKHALSGLLVQVLEIQETVSLEHALEQPVHVYSAASLPQTKYAVVAQSVGGETRFYGPFEATCVDGNGVQLQASSAFDLSIGEFCEADFDFCVEIVDDTGNLVAQFLSADELTSRFAQCERVIDWISDKELLDALGRISRSGESPLTKGQMRALKSEIADCLDEQAKIALTPERRSRMLGLLDTYEQWSSLPDSVKDSVIEKADPEQLASYVLSSDHFRAFYDKALESDSVRQRVEQEKARYAAQSEEAKAAAEKALGDLRRVEDQLQHFDEELDQRRKAFEREMASQVEQAEQQRNALVQEVQNLQEEKERLEAAKLGAQAQVNKVIAELSDGDALVGKVLEDAALRQVVSAASSLGEREPGYVQTQHELSDPHASGCFHLSDDEGADPRALLASLTKHIVEGYGRDMTENEVANVMICLMQGYITTFAGMPGTGKTSLVNILAEVLGLKHVGGKRFVDVPVEKGWTSYKDFIGYYNPFSKTLEKSNPAVFDALAQLSKETETGLTASQVPPFLFLLDEANLSSIEHYWSPFLRACDSFRSGSFELSLGGAQSFQVPGYVRFIATVNFDHTTEELSPRFLDRSWVVTLDSQALDFEDIDEAHVPFDFDSAPAYSYAALQRAFGANADNLLGGDMKAKLKEVVDLCARFRFPVSPRSQRMMLAYAGTASNVMDCSSAQSQYAPVDYAIAQKVLPALSGTEERLGGLLGELSLVSGLPLTKARVEHMLETGEDSGYYQYFA